ncbi:hypothetical protein F8388_004635 [Cannabis sativa]|uniref:Phosphoglycolate phosphatase n=1 Tax=Cannabis sativa TaxID=3483 RepID=A0A7J6FA73_CANSA|nr:hypothetical protein F8388_004635 [Cannabis sativa]
MLGRAVHSLSFNFCHFSKPIIEVIPNGEELHYSGSAQPLTNADELLTLSKHLSSTVMGKRLVFVTNNSTKSRKQYGKKFETLGLSVSEEIFASSFAAAAYLKSINFPKDKKDGILKELELAGIQYLGGPADGDKKIELKPGFLMEHDRICSRIDRYFNYYKIQYGTLCIRENPGCLFIATNRDAVTHLTDAQEWAEAQLSKNLDRQSKSYARKA